MPGEQRVLHKILGLICEDYGIAPFPTQTPTTDLPQTSASAEEPLAATTPAHIGEDVAKFTSVLVTSLQSLVDHIQLILEYVGALESEVNIAAKSGCSAEVSEDPAAAVSKRVADATVAEAGKVRLPADAADKARAELAAADTKLVADAFVAPETHAKKTADIDPETHAKKTADMANVLGVLVKDCTVSTNEYTWYNTFRIWSGDVRSLNVCSIKRKLSYSKYSGAHVKGARSMRAAGKTTRCDSRRTYFICDVTKGNLDNAITVRLYDHQEKVIFKMHISCVSVNSSTISDDIRQGMDSVIVEVDARDGTELTDSDSSERRILGQFRRLP